LTRADDCQVHRQLRSTKLRSMTFDDRGSGPLGWAILVLILLGVAAFEYWFVTRRLRRSGRSWPVALGLTVVMVLFFVAAQHSRG
jgi:hypothetical protein